jgi:predicted dehydrogenase
MKPIRAAVIGTGAFGRNHVRVLRHMAGVELAGICDANSERVASIAAEQQCAVFPSIEALYGKVDAAVVATPTSTHFEIARGLLEAGIDVLVEKPIAQSSAEGQTLAELAARTGRVLQIGHLERFNPAVIALESAATIPLFFEVHRLSVFTARSLDIDVVLDLMIHDLDIVLALTKEEPDEIRAAGISVLSHRVDIANVRLAFPSGCIANLTASRVSTEKVRKLRLFQPGQYISLDYERQDALSFSVDPAGSNATTATGPMPQIGFKTLPVLKGEPLQLELESFIACVRERSRPRVDAFQATNALRVSEAILGKIREHADLVTKTLHRA